MANHFRLSTHSHRCVTMFDRNIVITYNNHPKLVLKRKFLTQEGAQLNMNKISKENYQGLKEGRVFM